jgi:hypothetical protein
MRSSVVEACPERGAGGHFEKSISMDLGALALLTIALRFLPAPEFRSRLWLWIPIAVTAGAEYALFLITESSLEWHLSTSVNRLLAQLWPSAIWLFFSMLRTPEDLVPSAPASAAPRSSKRKNKQSV